MAEELRFFLRSAIYVVAVAVAYWFLSYEPAGTVLLAGLGIALLAFIAVAIGMERRTMAHMRTSGGPVRRAFGGLNRLLGFHEPPGAPAPLEGGPDVVPLTSPWPIVTAAALVLIGLGAIFGSWLMAPGFILLAGGGVGWLTQLDRP